MFLGYNNENYYINRREKNIELTNLNGLTNSLMKILKIMNTIMKVIEIKDNELISISGDKEMKIWILNKDNIFECITNIIFQDEISTSNIFKLNQKEFVTYSFIEENLKFWNSNNYSIITFIKNIELFGIFQTMCSLNNDILYVEGDN